MPLRVALIVEGHSEVQAAPIVLRRIWGELFRSDDPLDVLTPNRDSQGKLLNKDGLRRKVVESRKRLTKRQDGYRGLILILIDTEKRGCPKEQAPQLLGWAREAHSDADIACVMPNPMFETWFAACATSLAGHNDLPATVATPNDPEGKRLGKTWIRNALPRSRKYSETADAPRFAARMNLVECRANAPSFDKLCRVLEARLPPRPPEPPSVSAEST